MLPLYPRITGVEVRAHFVVALTFVDGTQGVVDLGPSMGGHGGMFTPIQDPDYFAQVLVDPSPVRSSGPTASISILTSCTTRPISPASPS